MNQYMIEILQSRSHMEMKLYEPKDDGFDTEAPLINHVMVDELTRNEVLEKIFIDQTGFEEWSSLHITPFFKGDCIGIRVFIYAKKINDIKTLLPPMMQLSLYGLLLEQAA